MDLQQFKRRIKLENKAEVILDKAIEYAENMKANKVSVDHVLYALVREYSDLKNYMIQEMGEATYAFHISNMDGNISNYYAGEGEMEPTVGLLNFLEQLSLEDNVNEFSMLQVLLDSEPEIEKQLQGLFDVDDFIDAAGSIDGGMNEDMDLLNAILTGGSRQINMPGNVFDKIMRDIMNTPSPKEMTKNSKGQQKPAFHKFVSVLNETVEERDIPFVGREEEIYRTSQILCRANKNNPILVGEPGVGKTAIIEGIAKTINNETCAEKLKNSTIYSLDMGALMGGSSLRGQFEQRLQDVLTGIVEESEKPILYIDEIHNIVGLGAGGESSFDAANLIKTYTTEGKIKFVGTTTYDEYKKKFQKDKAIDRRFNKVDVVEPSVQDTVEILKGLKPYYEEFHNVEFSEESLVSAAELADKYISNKFLPDKAIDLIDEAGAKVSMGAVEGSKTKKITTEMISEVLSRTCNIPRQTVESDDKKQIMNLERDIKKVVFGQDEAVSQIVNSIKLSRAGLNDENKPIASLLFVGPTGVGKTEIAKQTAKMMFGGEKKLIRFDMSEYMEEHSVSKLIGSPAGYVGYDEGGLLVDTIIKNPSCVLLFDEIEKAHPKVFNALLQIMDYATLTDNKGRKADFKNVLIILTSNAGAHVETSSLGFNPVSVSNQERANMMEAVKEKFAPEFRNRLTKIISFNGMNDDMAKLIVSKELKTFGKKLEKQNVSVSFTKLVKDYLQERGISKNFGAREIQRVINNEIKPLFIDELLDGGLKDGGKCTITMKDGSPVIKIK